jgi:hypothetical protein
LKRVPFSTVGIITSGAIMAPFVFWLVRLQLDWDRRLLLLLFGVAIALPIGWATSKWMERVRGNHELVKRDVSLVIFIAIIILILTLALILFGRPGIPYF